MFERKVDAEKHLTHIAHTMATGAYVDPRAGRAVTVQEYAEQWRGRQLHREGTAVSTEHRLRLHLYPALGARPMGSVRPADIQAWVTDRSAVLAPITVHQHYHTVAAIFGDAVRNRVLISTPCVDVQLPRLPLADTTIPTADEVSAIARHTPERYRLLVMLAAGAGLRLGEALGLGPEHVGESTVSVERQLVTISGEGAVLRPPKTPSATRTIPVGRSVLDAVAEHVEQFPSVDGRLTSTQYGTPVRANVFQQSWGRTCRRAGVEGVTFHDLRHFFASALIAQGCSVVAVQKALGHSRATQTLNTYTHLWPTDEDTTRAAIDAVLGEVDLKSQAA